MQHHKTFRNTEQTKSVGYNIVTLLRKRPTKGAVGIEIEVEGVKLPKNQEELLPIWHYHKDHSLRGEDNAEYVLVRPIEFDKVEDSLKHLWNLFTKYDSVLDESNRTSVHVHLNVQKFHLNRLTSFMALYFSVEELLTAWCGEHRVGNLFCLRAKDAPAIISHIKRFIKSDGRTELPERLHYAGLNAHALAKFGSIEVRTLRGVSNPEVILDWIGFLERLYTLSGEMTDPRTVCDMFSAEGPMSFLQQVLGPKTQALRAGIDYTEEQIRDSLYDGIRLAQDLCYCRDWDLYQPTDIKEDPFGRSSRKVMESMTLNEPSMTQQYINALNYINNTPVPLAYAMNGDVPPAPTTVETWASLNPANVPEYPEDLEDYEGEDDEEQEPEEDPFA